MEKFKKVLRWFSPPIWVMVLLVIAAGLGLGWVFAGGNEEHPLSYAVYVASFYTLCVWSIKVPGMIKNGKNLVYSNALARRYFTDKIFKAKVKLYRSTAVNLAFGIFKLVIGILYDSIWFVSVAVYYMVLAVLRFLLIRSQRRTDKLEQEESMVSQWESYRLCGWLLLVLNVAITGMVIQMIWNNQGFTYPGYVIFVMAAFTFYKMTMSLVKAFTHRKERSPVYSAAGWMDVSAALMSIFALQTGMFSSFGADTTEEARFLMNSLTGGGVSIAVVWIAVFMIFWSNRTLTSIKKKQEERADGTQR